jgi:tetratricopeptide (TPR) repeat protein
MHFLQFAYLQLGRGGEAKKVALQAMRLPGEKDCEPGDYVAASYALQAHDWDMAKRLNVQGNSDSLPDAEVMWTAAGIAAARTGDLKTAQRAAVELAAVRDTAAKKIAGTQNSPFEAARLEVEAWIAQAQGNSGKALEQMRRADEIGGYPSWAQPTAAEQLGDLLLEQHQAAAALAAYRKTLQNTPNLFNALYGAALAAERTGDASTAREYYRQLVAVAGDGDRREVAVAKKSLESQGP